MKNSPVETSRNARPKVSFRSGATAIRYWAPAEPSIEESMSVPGVTTLVTSRFTTPFAVFGSSTWSQITTRYPLFTRRAM